MKRSVKKIYLILLILFFTSTLFIPEAIYADNLKFEASADRSVVALGQRVKLQLKFEGSQDIPSPRLPDLDGFRSRYLGPSTMMSFVNGRMSSSITHIYTLIPIKTGKFKIGPLSFNYKDDDYTSDAVDIEVVDSPSGLTGRSQINKGAETVINDRIFLKMESGKSSSYLNEVIPLTFKLFVGGIGVRDIQYPVFEHEGISAGDFEEPRQYKELIGGVMYDVIEFKTEIFGTRTGQLSIGPAGIECNLVTKRERRHSSSMFDNFFGRDPFGGFMGFQTSPIKLTSDKLSLKVLPFPDENKPGNFKGAVGHFDLDIEASPLEVKEGDPITVKMTLTGDGNFSTLPAPVIKKNELFKTYEPHISSKGKKKVFEQVFIPKSKDIKTLPNVIFSYFNPEENAYKTILKKGMKIRVLEPDKREEITILEAAQPVEKILAEEKLGKDIIYIKESPGSLRKKGSYLYREPLFYLFQILPLTLFIAALIFYKKRERLLTDAGYARRVSASPKARRGLKEAEKLLRADDLQGFYLSINKTMREYIGNRFYLSSGGMTSDITANVLKDEGISENILASIRDLFNECDTARYAPSEFKRGNMERSLDKLSNVITYFERRKP